MNYPSFYIYEIVKPSRITTYGRIYIEDYPLLLKNIPVGVPLKKLYQEHLVKLLIADETRQEMLDMLTSILESARVDSRKNGQKKLRPEMDKNTYTEIFKANYFIITVCCREHRGQNVLMAFSDFLKGVIPGYLEDVYLIKEKTTINTETNSWSNVLVVEDVIPKNETPKPLVFPETYKPDLDSFICISDPLDN